jgi:hypothetical protein
VRRRRWFLCRHDKPEKYKCPSCHRKTCRFCGNDVCLYCAVESVVGPVEVEGFPWVECEKDPDDTHDRGSVEIICPPFDVTVWYPEKRCRLFGSMVSLHIGEAYYFQGTHRTKEEAQQVAIAAARVLSGQIKTVIKWAEELRAPLPMAWERVGVGPVDWLQDSALAEGLAEWADDDGWGLP